MKYKQASSIANMVTMIRGYWTLLPLIGMGMMHLKVVKNSAVS